MVITFDRDFGELIFRQGASAGTGVILFRFVPTSPREPGELLLQLLGQAGAIADGQFVVIERDRVRRRALPSQGR